MEIAADKEARKANKGLLPSVLGVDGYNPSITPGSVSSAPSLSSGGPAGGEHKQQDSASSSTAMSKEAAKKAIDSSIALIMKYRTAGDGGQALKLLLTFVKNVSDNPQETKYVTLF